MINCAHFQDSARIYPLYGILAAFNRKFRTDQARSANAQRFLMKNNIDECGPELMLEHQVDMYPMAYANLKNKTLKKLAQSAFESGFEIKQKSRCKHCHSLYVKQSGVAQSGWRLAEQGSEQNFGTLGLFHSIIGPKFEAILRKRLEKESLTSRWRRR